jgi:hypothetical protein
MHTDTQREEVLRPNSPGIQRGSNRFISPPFWFFSKQPCKIKESNATNWEGKVMNPYYWRAGREWPVLDEEDESLEEEWFWDEDLLFEDEENPEPDFLNDPLFWAIID